jgi:hypothetical protein
MIKNLFNITIETRTGKKIISVPFASSGFIKFDKSLEYGYKVISDKELIKLANIPQSLITPQEICTIIYGNPEDNNIYGQENLISSSGYSLLDTRDGQKTYTLPIAADCTIKTIGLLEDWGFPAIISVEPFGALRINPGDKPIQLIFKDKWRIMSIDKSFSPYVESGRIYSTNIESKFGKSVALSADGSIMVVGEPDKPGGATSIYSRAGTTWNKVTEKTKYPDQTLKEGWSVAISADGKRIVSGTPNFEQVTGLITIYTFNNGVWDDGISLFYGESGIVQGESVSISANGNNIVTKIDNNYMVIYNYNINNTWSSLRTPINFAVRSLAISADGKTFVAGLLINGNGGIIIYTFTNNWDNGTILISDNPNQYEGTSVDISDDGCTIVVGVPSPTDSFNIVYEKVNGEWNAGFKLYPPEHLADIYEGSAVAICGFGNTIISSCPTSLYHLLHIYHRTIGGWIFDREIQSPSISTNSSMSIATSSDGSITMLGDSDRDDNNGQVIIFY